LLPWTAIPQDREAECGIDDEQGIEGKPVSWVRSGDDKRPEVEDYGGKKNQAAIEWRKTPATPTDYGPAEEDSSDNRLNRNHDGPLDE
jgi:hypothetical protein